MHEASSDRRSGRDDVRPSQVIGYRGDGDGYSSERDAKTRPHGWFGPYKDHSTADCGHFARRHLAP